MWTKRIKVAGSIIGLFVIAFMNGAFSSDNRHNAVLVDRSVAEEMISWSNVRVTLAESWFLFVAFGFYIVLRQINNYLDAEEERIQQAKNEAEKPFEVDDSDSTS